MALCNTQIQDMQAYPEKLKRLIKRRFKIDLNDAKTGMNGKHLKTMSDTEEELISFAHTVFVAQQAEINTLKNATSQFLNAFSELKDVVADSND